MADFTCTACGCLCDDGKLCEAGQTWFRLASVNTPVAAAEVNGQPAELNEAIAQAAALLAAARFPLVFDLAPLDVNAQRAAVALADELGAALDSGTPYDSTADMLPTVGKMACTWGDVIERADLIVYWRCNLETDHWRHQELVLDRVQRRGNCHVVNVVDQAHPAGGDNVVIPRGRDFDTVWTLRALVEGKSVRGEILPELQRLAKQLCTARYAVIIHDGDTVVTKALHALATDLNLNSRCRLIDLGRARNAAGETEVVSWQTGYSRAVGLHRGHPIAYGCEFAAETLLARREVDAAFSVGGGIAGQLSVKALTHLRTISYVGLSPGWPLFDETPQIILFAATPAIDAAGTVFRADGITLPLRPVNTPSFPPADVVIQRLTSAVRAARA